VPDKTDPALDSSVEKTTQRHPALESVTERVHYVADLMAAALWNERTSRRLQRELGQRWGVSPSTIRNYSTEASRAIQDAIIERRAAIAQRAMDRLEKIGGVDIATPGIPGLAGAVVHANELLLKISGFAEPDEDKAHPLAGPAVVINMTGATDPGSETPGAAPAPASEPPPPDAPV